MSGTAGASRGSSPAGSGVSAGADAARAVIATCTAATSSRAGAELARYPLALASLISASRRFISSNESPRLFVDDTPVSWSISRSRSSLKSFFFFFRGCGVFGVIEEEQKHASIIEWSRIEPDCRCAHEHRERARAHVWGGDRESLLGNVDLNCSRLYHLRRTAYLYIFYFNSHFLYISVQQLAALNRGCPYQRPLFVSCYGFYVIFEKRQFKRLNIYAILNPI